MIDPIERVLMNDPGVEYSLDAEVDFIEEEEEEEEEFEINDLDEDIHELDFN